MSENGVVGKLVDRYLAAHYPNYFESTRAPLLTQARDLLMHTFHGDLLRFETEFLSPAAELIENLKNRFCNLSVSVFYICISLPSSLPVNVYFFLRDFFHRLLHLNKKLFYAVRV